MVGSAGLSVVGTMGVTGVMTVPTPAAGAVGSRSSRDVLEGAVAERHDGGAHAAGLRVPLVAHAQVYGLHAQQREQVLGLAHEVESTLSADVRDSPGAGMALEADPEQRLLRRGDVGVEVGLMLGEGHLTETVELGAGPGAHRVVDPVRQAATGRAGDGGRQDAAVLGEVGGGAEDDEENPFMILSPTSPETCWGVM